MIERKNFEKFQHGFPASSLSIHFVVLSSDVIGKLKYLTEF
jgi:hypothetical protein